jgi:hypothetical protein
MLSKIRLSRRGHPKKKYIQTLLPLLHFSGLSLPGRPDITVRAFPAFRFRNRSSGCCRIRLGLGQWLLLGTTRGTGLEDSCSTQTIVNMCVKSCVVRPQGFAAYRTDVVFLFSFSFSFLLLLVPSSWLHSSFQSRCQVFLRLDGSKNMFNRRYDLLAICGVSSLLRCGRCAL